MNPGFNAPISFGTITLHLRKLAATHRISGHMLEQLRVEANPSMNSFFADDLLLTLSTEAWTQNLPPEQVETTRAYGFETPDSWWQHAKRQYCDRWWMGWLARRRPPRMRKRTVTGTFVVDLDRFRVYPAAPPVPKSYGAPILQHVVSSAVQWMCSEPEEDAGFLQRSPYFANRSPAGPAADGSGEPQ
jgi:hypothetical protein